MRRRKCRGRVRVRASARADFLYYYVVCGSLLLLSPACACDLFLVVIVLYRVPTQKNTRRILLVGFWFVVLACSTHIRHLDCKVTSNITTLCLFCSCSNQNVQASSALYYIDVFVCVARQVHWPCACKSRTEPWTHSNTHAEHRTRTHAMIAQRQFCVMLLVIICPAAPLS